MTEFLITLTTRMQFCGSLTVEAKTFDEARAAALSRADEASWPIDECGGTLRPSDQEAEVVADYGQNLETKEEIYFDEALPLLPSAAHPVPSDAPALAAPDYASAIAAGWAKVERDPSPDRCEEGPVWYHAELDRAMPLDTSCRDLCREVGADEEDPADPVKADMLAALKRLAEIIRDRHRLHGEDIGYALASLKDAEAIIARAKGEA